MIFSFIVICMDIRSAGIFLCSEITNQQQNTKIKKRFFQCKFYLDINQYVGYFNRILICSVFKIVVSLYKNLRRPVVES